MFLSHQCFSLSPSLSGIFKYIFGSGYLKKDLAALIVCQEPLCLAQRSSTASRRGPDLAGERAKSDKQQRGHSNT